jgi:hypothetical protein
MTGPVLTTLEKIKEKIDLFHKDKIPPLLPDAGR